MSSGEDACPRQVPRHPCPRPSTLRRPPGKRTGSLGRGRCPVGQGRRGALARDSAPRDKEAGVLLSRGGHSTAMNLTSAVPKVTNTPTSVLPPPARPPGKLSLFTGCLDSLGGSERGVPRQSSDWARGCFYRAELSQEAESRLCLESSLNRNMLNSFLFYQLTASNR